VPALIGCRHDGLKIEPPHVANRPKTPQATINTLQISDSVPLVTCPKTSAQWDCFLPMLITVKDAVTLIISAAFLTVGTDEFRSM